jgi:hypothetical protein
MKVCPVRGVTGFDLVDKGRLVRVLVMQYASVLVSWPDVMVDVDDERVRVVRGEEIVDIKAGQGEDG